MRESESISVVGWFPRGGRRKRAKVGARREGRNREVGEPAKGQGSLVGERERERARRERYRKTRRREKERSATMREEAA